VAAIRNASSAWPEKTIVTLEGTRGEPFVRIHPWLYDLSARNDGPLPLRLKVLPGMSPIRQALISRKSLPEQDLAAWDKVPLRRIRVGSEVAPPALEALSEVDPLTREKTLTHLAEALQGESGDEVEQHITGFGSILVARLKGAEYLAFALSAAWPMTVLDIHRMNRTSGTTEPQKKPTNLAATDVEGIVKAFKAAKASKGSDDNVDN
jgi:hypothetical protein